MRRAVISQYDCNAGHAFEADEPDFEPLSFVAGDDRGMTSLDETAMGDWRVRGLENLSKVECDRFEVRLQYREIRGRQRR